MARREAFVQLSLTILDVPRFLCAMLLLSTIYRVPSAFEQWTSRSRHNEKGTSTEGGEDTREGIYDGHIFFFRQTCEILIDIPFIACLFASLWRMPSGLYYAAYEAKDQSKARLNCFRSLIVALLDIPTALATLLLLLTCYRLPSTMDKYQQFKREDLPGATHPDDVDFSFRTHCFLLGEFSELALDTMAWPSAFILLLGPWR